MKLSREPTHYFTHLINTVISSSGGTKSPSSLQLVRNRILNVSLSNPIRCATDSFAGHGTFLYLSDMKRRFLRGGSPQWNQVDIPGETEAILRVKLNADIESPDTQSLYTLCEVS